MSTNTYVALDKVTVGTAAASVSFTGISGSYTDLEIIIEGAMTASSDMRIQFNGDTATNYSNTTLEGNGTTAQSARWSNQTKLIVNNFATGTGRGTYRLAINNYSNTTTFKTVLHRMGFAGNATEAGVGLWRSTSAITSMELFANGTTWVSGTTFSLYGIAASGAGAKATGGAIYADSTYYYHVFSGSGTFTPTQSITADMLVIAGGGGGGKAGDRGAGGGGAGGLLGFASQSLTATGYTVTVGAGGAGATSGNAQGSNGSDSQFAALTLVKGGGGAGSEYVPYHTGVTGGSGGGAGGQSVNGGSAAGGSATSGQGFAGGNGFAANASTAAGAGGGGAGAAGANASSATPTAGGNGLTTYSSWGSATGTGENVSGTYYYAGGGGGAGGGNSATYAKAGGLGGGGASNAINGGTATSGTIGTGGGGGGQSYNGTPGAGGSGIVIVRYAKV